jgi:hypothetical protein
LNEYSAALAAGANVRLPINMAEVSSAAGTRVNNFMGFFLRISAGFQKDGAPQNSSAPSWLV